jgi:hypothetical protein
MRHHPAASDFNGQIPAPPGKLVHLKSAPCLWCGYGFDNLILPGQRALFFALIKWIEDHHEYFGLDAPRDRIVR